MLTIGLCIALGVYLPWVLITGSPTHSFCRKTTLTKHQHRSHCAGTMTRPSSEEAMSEHSYHTPVAISFPHDGQPPHYLMPPHQHPYFQPQPPTPTHEFYPSPHIQTTHVAAQDPIVVPQTIAVTSPTEVHHAQQHLRRYDPSPPDYLHPDFHPPTYTGFPMLYDLDYKTAPRVLNQPEGADWNFLGVG